jgi:hypothetical protein
LVFRHRQRSRLRPHSCFGLIRSPASLRLNRTGAMAEETLTVGGFTVVAHPRASRPLNCSTHPII